MTIKSRRSKFQQMQLRQVKHLIDATEAYQNRSKSTALRRYILEKRKMRNYSSEYEGIRNRTENPTTATINRDGLKARVNRSKQMGARAVDKIS